MSAGTNRIITPLIVVFVLVTTAPTFAGKIIYVDDDTTGKNNGRSWADAFNYLQDALAVAQTGDEIRVAQGIYKPDQHVVINPPFDPQVVQSGSAAATFRLKNGIALKGGYAGISEPDPNARNVEMYETTLSGDLNGDDLHVANPEDLLDEPTRAENSYHIVKSIDTDETAVLDGFTITAGNDNRYIYPRPPQRRPKSPIGCGAGMFNQGGSPMVTNCTFTENAANNGGGGVWNINGIKTFMNCTFSRNSASINGGGIYNYNTNLILSNCSFNDNSAGTDGGGMYNSSANPTLSNCTFNGNSAGDDGGGMCNIENSNPKLTNCIFSGNKAVGSSNYGGGICNKGGSLNLTNCTFSDNMAGGGGGIFSGNDTSFDLGLVNLANCKFCNNSAEKGGGIYYFWNRPTVINSTFTGNSAEWGGGIYCWYTNDVWLTNCTFIANSAANGNALACDSYQQKYPSNFQITNCILWDVDGGILNNDSSTVSIMYSDVKDGWTGEGNINADPCFVDPGYWDVNGVWIDGDYHLLEDSPCINAGNSSLLPPDSDDLDRDGDKDEPIPWDLDGTSRVVDCRIDMGAYEYGQFVPAEVRIVPRTINLSSKGKWITCFIWLPEEYDVSDIDPNSILFECEIEVESLQVDEQEQIAVAKFIREDVQPILEVGDVELTITGKLTDGTDFEGTDIIKVTDKAGK